MNRTDTLEKELADIWQQFIAKHPPVQGWRDRYIRFEIVRCIYRMRRMLEIPTPRKWWTRYALPYVWSGKVVLAPEDRGAIAVQLNP